MLLFKNFYIPLFSSVFFWGCEIQEQKKPALNFTIEKKTLGADTVIISVVYFEDYIVCLQQDNKIFVLDTSFNKNHELTSKFANLKVDFLNSLSDTIFITVGKDLFFLDKGFILKEYNRPPFKYMYPYYDDKTYYVYACSAGEWGGGVFFMNKKTNKTYSYPATAVQQVFKFEDTYIVSNFLSHLSGFSDYLSIKDPTKLYELKDEKQKTFCNWYMEIDSIKDKKLFDTIMPPGVKYYSDTFTTRTLMTFPYKNEIYSIYCTDKATILVKFQNSKLNLVDTLLRNPLYFHNATTHLASKAIITAYEATGAVGRGENSWTPYQNSGLIFIRNNKITFLEFQMPHMWSDDNRR